MRLGQEGLKPRLKVNHPCESQKIYTPANGTTVPPIYTSYYVFQLNASIIINGLW